MQIDQASQAFHSRGEKGLRGQRCRVACVWVSGRWREYSNNAVCLKMDNLRGTHAVFLAEVQAAHAEEGMPLAYYRGRMGKFVFSPAEGKAPLWRDVSQ